jgi:hypothetical protein
MSLVEHMRRRGWYVSEADECRIVLAQLRNGRLIRCILPQATPYDVSH